MITDIIRHCSLISDARDISDCTYARVYNNNNRFRGVYFFFFLKYTYRLKK